MNGVATYNILISACHFPQLSNQSEYVTRFPVSYWLIMLLFLVFSGSRSCFVYRTTPTTMGNRQIELEWRHIRYLVQKGIGKHGVWVP
jgi:hypothetical protein